jgi:hypothetical protein
MRAETNLEPTLGRPDLVNVRKPGAKKIFLPEMAKIRAQFAGQRRVVIEHQSNACGSCDGQNPLGHAAYFIERGPFRPQLNQVGAAFAKLTCQHFRCAPPKVSGVYKCIKTAIRKRSHRSSPSKNFSSIEAQLGSLARLAAYLPLNVFTFFKLHELRNTRAQKSANRQPSR